MCKTRDFRSFFADQFLKHLSKDLHAHFGVETFTLVCIIPDDIKKIVWQVHSDVVEQLLHYSFTTSLFIITSIKK